MLPEKVPCIELDHVKEVVGSETLYDTELDERGGRSWNTV